MICRGDIQNLYIQLDAFEYLENSNCYNANNPEQRHAGKDILLRLIVECLLTIRLTVVVVYFVVQDG